MELILFLLCSNTPDYCIDDHQLNIVKYIELTINLEVNELGVNLRKVQVEID